MTKLQSGDLVKLAHNGKEGIGYIYDNGDTENPHLIIGISWKDGGTSNTTIFEAEAEGVVFTKVELKKTFEQELLKLSMQRLRKWKMRYWTISKNMM